MKERLHRGPRGAKKIIIFLLFAAVVLLALGGVVMLLWNAILPALLHVGTLSYWHAVGLLVLCKILFTSFSPGARNKRPFLSAPPAHIRENFMQMSQNEKVTFKQEFEKRCAERKA